MARLHTMQVMLPLCLSDSTKLGIVPYDALHAASTMSVLQMCLVSVHGRSSGGVPLHKHETSRFARDDNMLKLCSGFDNEGILHWTLFVIGPPSIINIAQ